MSSLIAEAFSDWRVCRQAYEEVLYAQYERAAQACNDRLVNADGRARGIDPLSLFMGNRVRAYRWASEELIEFWQTHARTTFADFERQWSKSERSYT